LHKPDRFAAYDSRFGVKTKRAGSTTGLGYSSICTIKKADITSVSSQLRICTKQIREQKRTLLFAHVLTHNFQAVITANAGLQVRKTISTAKIAHTKKIESQNGGMF